MKTLPKTIILLGILLLLTTSVIAADTFILPTEFSYVAREKPTTVCNASCGYYGSGAYQGSECPCMGTLKGWPLSTNVSGLYMKWTGITPARNVYLNCSLMFGSSLEFNHSLLYRYLPGQSIITWYEGGSVVTILPNWTSSNITWDNQPLECYPEYNYCLNGYGGDNIPDSPVELTGFWNLTQYGLYGNNVESYPEFSMTDIDLVLMPIIEGRTYPERGRVALENPAYYNPVNPALHPTCLLQTEGLMASNVNVYASINNKPKLGVMINLCLNGTGTCRHLSTDSNGQTTFTTTIYGDYTVDAAIGGLIYPTQTLKVDQPTETVRFDITCENCHGNETLYYGRVIQNGLPVENASVALFGIADSDDDYRSYYTETDINGTYNMSIEKGTYQGWASKNSDIADQYPETIHITETFFYVYVLPDSTPLVINVTVYSAPATPLNNAEISIQHCDEAVCKNIGYKRSDINGIATFTFTPNQLDSSWTNLKIVGGLNGYKSDSVFVTIGDGITYIEPSLILPPKSNHTVIIRARDSASLYPLPAVGIANAEVTATFQGEQPYEVYSLKRWTNNTGDAPFTMTFHPIGLTVTVKKEPEYYPKLNYVMFEVDGSDHQIDAYYNQPQTVYLERRLPYANETTNVSGYITDATTHLGLYDVEVTAVCSKGGHYGTKTFTTWTESNVTGNQGQYMFYNELGSMIEIGMTCTFTAHSALDIYPDANVVPQNPSYTISSPQEINFTITPSTPGVFYRWRIEGIDELNQNFWLNGVKVSYELLDTNITCYNNYGYITSSTSNTGEKGTALITNLCNGTYKFTFDLTDYKQRTLNRLIQGVNRRETVTLNSTHPPEHQCYITGKVVKEVMANQTIMEVPTSAKVYLSMTGGNIYLADSDAQTGYFSKKVALGNYKITAKDSNGILTPLTTYVYLSWNTQTQDCDWNNLVLVISASASTTTTSIPGHHYTEGEILEWMWVNVPPLFYLLVLMFFMSAVKRF